jgi:hypothetical protein
MNEMYSPAWAKLWVAARVGNNKPAAATQLRSKSRDFRMELGVS